MTENELLQKTIQTIETVGGYSAFGTDISKDEIAENLSFFIFNSKGAIKKADTPNQYLRDFDLFFITREDAEIDEFALILALQKRGLRFRRTEYDYGKIKNTEVEAKMTTFNFHRALVIRE